MHWPIVLMLTDARLHTTGWLSVSIRIAVSLAAAEALNRVVENPARTRLANLSTQRIVGLWFAGLVLSSAAAVALL